MISLDLMLEASIIFGDIFTILYDFFAIIFDTLDFFENVMMAFHIKRYDGAAE